MVRSPTVMTSSSTAASADSGNTYRPSTQSSPEFENVWVTRTLATLPVTCACMAVATRSASTVSASGDDFKYKVPDRTSSGSCALASGAAAKVNVAAANTTDTARIKRWTYFTDGSLARWEHYERRMCREAASKVALGRWILTKCGAARAAQTRVRRAPFSATGIVNSSLARRERRRPPRDGCRRRHVKKFSRAGENQETRLSRSTPRLPPPHNKLGGDHASTHHENWANENRRECSRHDI